MNPNKIASRPDMPHKMPNRLRPSKTLALFSSLLAMSTSLLFECPAYCQERSQKLESVLQKGRAFAGSGARFRVQTFEKEALVQVFSFPNNPKSRLQESIQAARVLVNFSPTQFTIVSVRFADLTNPRVYNEVIVGNKDIVSLSAGSSTLDSLAKNIQPIDIGSQDNENSILNKYLLVAENQMSASNYWEAEQIVDAALRAVGTTPGDQSRLTQDMLSLADGLDARGDLDRAEKVLKKVLEVRSQTGHLDDSDADRTISHLTELYLTDQHYTDAIDLLTKLLSNTVFSESTNPDGYANILERLGVCHFKSKDAAQALTEFTKVADIRRRQKGDKSPLLARALEEVGDSQKVQGQMQEAQSNYKEAHSIYDHAVVSNSRADKMDYSIYEAHVKQLDQKLASHN